MWHCFLSQFWLKRRYWRLDSSQVRFLRFFVLSSCLCSFFFPLFSFFVRRLPSSFLGGPCFLMSPPCLTKGKERRRQTKRAPKAEGRRGWETRRQEHRRQRSQNEREGWETRLQGQRRPQSCRFTTPGGKAARAAKAPSMKGDEAGRQGARGSEGSHHAGDKAAKG